MEADKFIFFAFQHIGGFFRSVPGKTKYSILVIYFISKPLLEAGGGRKEFI